MHIFLTGASGFAGKNLIPYLLDRDCRLTCLLRDPARLPEELRSRVAVVVGDLTHLGMDVVSALASAETVVHLAGQLWGRTYEDFDRVNRQGTEALIEAITQADVPLRRFLYLSSIAAVGPARIGQPLTEASTEAPISWYGQTKLAGEQALAGAAFPWTVIRAPAVYGPWDPATLIFFKLAACHIHPITCWGRPEHSTIHVEDVCRAIWLALTSETRSHSTYFINDGQAIHRLREVMALVVESVDKWVVPVPIPGGLVLAAEGLLALGQRIGLTPSRLTPDKLRELRQPAWTCSAELITENLGFKASVPLGQGISETAAWYRANGWL
ncbi:MAG: NAD-dependent epimerase/dehydratase family protein [Calditrichaeota bacterium]|nr:NAD-dependent epimerase/dehydratase family protein [Calditrichota bacterium]